MSPSLEKTTAALRKYYEESGVSSETPSDDVTAEDLDKVCSMFGVTRGGYSEVSGGADRSVGVGKMHTLAEYGSSMYSKAKETLIRNIAEDVFKTLGKKVNVRSVPIEKVVKDLLDLIPANMRDPKKFSAKIRGDGGIQRKICVALSSAINKYYSGALIDINGDESVMCQKMYEVLMSLLTGLNVEFINVAADVMRVMRNMHMANDYLEAAYKKQMDLVRRSGDSAAKDNAASTDEVYRAVKSEYSRQEAILANLLNVAIKPTGQELVSSLEGNNDFKGLVKELRGMLGEQSFGDKLAFLLSGVTTVAHNAALIDKALKRIGMSVREFKSAPNAGALRSMMLKHILAMKPDSRKLENMMSAMKVILDANYDHASISKLLNGKAGGADSDDDNVALGGADENNGQYWETKSLAKSLERTDKTRKLLVKEFMASVKEGIRSITRAVSPIGAQIGKSIPTSEELKEFINAFTDIPIVDKDSMAQALSGYYKDSTSKESRAEFLQKYDTVLRTLQPLITGHQSAVFRPIASAISSLVKLIDDFSEKVMGNLSVITPITPDEAAEKLRDKGAQFFGSGDDDTHGSWVELAKVRNDLSYYFDISVIQVNLKASATSAKASKEIYEQMLGEESAWLIDKIQKKLVEKLEHVTYENISSAGALPLVPESVRRIVNKLRTHTKTAAATASAVVSADAAAAALKKELTELVKNLHYMWSFQADAKVQMIKAAQAIDMYMAAFADGIARNPDSIKSILSLLQEVEMVAKWHNEESGNTLAALFDVFPSDYAGGVANLNSSVVEETGSINVYSNGIHYYKWLGEKDRNVSFPGNHALGRYLGAQDGTVNRLANKQVGLNEKQCLGVVTLSKKVTKSMRALENILSVFSSVGSKFGDVDLQSKTFMTPGQIYNVLCNYVAASAFAVEFGQHDQDVHFGKTGLASDYTSLPTNNRHAPVTSAAAGYGNAAAAVGAAGVKQILCGVDDRAYDNTANAANNNARSVASIALASVHDNVVHTAPTAYTGGLRTGASATHLNKWDYHNAESNEAERIDVCGWRDAFYDTDHLFQMTLKSIAAKVLTVVDAYRMFHRPTTDVSNRDSLNPLRTILGGVEGGALPSVKVIPEALEVYYRLVLLAEWYRERFGFKATGDQVATTNGYRVAMVPSVDGVWADFVNIIFDTASYVTEGNYTETQVQKLILAVNQIYRKYKTSNATACRVILNEFVVEMNRVMGFLKAEDISAYEKSRRAMFTPGSSVSDATEDFLNYDILDADDQFAARPAPSDKFANVNVNRNKTLKERTMVQLLSAVEKFHTDVSTDFIANTQESQKTSGVFRETLRSYKSELTNASNEEAEYKVILRMLQGANKFVNYNNDKVIMVHELVAYPLTVLHNLYKVVNKYNSLVQGASLANIAAWNKSRIAGTTGNAAINTTLGGITEYYKYLVESMEAKVPKASREVIARSWATALFGRDLYNVPSKESPSGYIVRPVEVGAVGPAGFISVKHLDAAHLAQDLISQLLEFNSNSVKLVTVKVGANGNINVDFSALEEHVKILMAVVKENINKLRVGLGVAQGKILDKYETAANVGSLRWLEENFVEILLNDRDEVGLSRSVNHLERTLSALSKAGAVTPDALVGDVDARYGTVAQAFDGLLYYEHKAGLFDSRDKVQCAYMHEFPFNFIPAKRTLTTDDKNAIAAINLPNNEANITKSVINTMNEILQIPCVSFTNYGQLNTWDLHEGERSLLLTLNKALHMYLYCNFDDGSKKIYAPLIETFASGAASYEVLQNKAFPNVSNVSLPDREIFVKLYSLNHNYNEIVDADGILGCPDPKSVVFASSALVLQSLLNTSVGVGNVQKKQFLYDSIVDIPEHMRERLRVNLPFFSKIFNSLEERAVLLKQLVSSSALNKNIAPTSESMLKVKDVARRITTTSTPLTARSNDSVTYYNSMLSKVIECAASLRKISDAVYKELDDKPPAFGDLQKDFIADYRSRNGTYPLMPTSSLLAASTCLDNINELSTSTDASTLGLPVKENGSAVYKFNYSTRLVLARNNLQLNMSHFPGAAELYASYSNVAPKAGVPSSSEYSSSILTSALLSKFIADGVTDCRLFGNRARYSRLSYARSSVYADILNDDTSEHTRVDMDLIKCVVEHPLLTQLHEVRAAVNVIARTMPSATVFDAVPYKTFDVGNARAITTLPGHSRLPLAEHKEFNDARVDVANYALVNTINFLATSDTARGTATQAGGAYNAVGPTAKVATMTLDNAVAAGNAVASAMNGSVVIVAAGNDLKDFYMPPNASNKGKDVEAVEWEKSYAHNVRILNNKFVKKWLAKTALVIPDVFKKIMNHVIYKHEGGSDEDKVIVDKNSYNPINATSNVISLFGVSGRAVAVGSVDTLMLQGLLGSSQKVITNLIEKLKTKIIDENDKLLAGTIDVSLADGCLSKGNIQPDPSKPDAVKKDQFDKILEHTRAVMEMGRDLSDFYKELINSIVQAGKSIHYSNSIDAIVDSLKDKLNVHLQAAPASPTFAEAKASGMNDVLDVLHKGIDMKSIDLADYSTVDNDAYKKVALASASGIASSKEESKDIRVLAIADLEGINGVVELTENSQIANSKERLAKFVGLKDDSTMMVREKLRTFNILDANIVPVNVHAFMREVPFVNLLNYSYTFDRMIHDFIIPKYIDAKNSVMIAPDTLVSNTREMLVKLLTLPHCDLGKDARQYYGLIASLFNGNDSLGMGRPRYLSDQLWHKVLMTSSISEVSAFEEDNAEGGPRSYDAANNAVRAGIAADAFGPDGAIAKLIAAGVINGTSDNATTKIAYNAAITGLTNKDLLHEAVKKATANPGASEEVKFFCEVVSAFVTSCNQVLAANDADLVRVVTALHGNHADTKARAKAYNDILERVKPLVVPSRSLKPVTTAHLKVYDNNKWTTVVADTNHYAPSDVQYVAELGKMRFDTKIVRNLTWFAQLQRILRVVLTEHMSYIDSPVVRGMKIADASFTEYQGNDVYDVDMYSATNYRRRK